MNYINYKNEDGTIETIEDMRELSLTDKRYLIDEYAQVSSSYYASQRATKAFYQDQ